MKSLYKMVFLMTVFLMGTLTFSEQVKGATNEPPVFCYADRHASSDRIQAIGGSETSGMLACIETPELRSDHILKAISFYSKGHDPNGMIVILDAKQKVIFAQNYVVRTGWNNYRFTSPISLQSGKYYLGYYIHPTKDYEYPIALDGEIAVRESCWSGIIKDGSQLEKGEEIELRNIRSYDKGSLLIGAEIDGPDVENCGFPLEVRGKLDAAPNVYGTLEVVTRNVGTKPIKTLTCKTELDGNFTSTEAIGRVEPGETSTIKLRYKFPNEGIKKQVTLNITKINGQDNPLVANFVKFIINIREGNEPFEIRTILIEEYTSEKCPNCPRGRPFIREAKEKFTQAGYEVSVIAYHNGFRHDKWSISEADQLIPYLFNSDRAFAPAALVNRLAVGKGGACAFVLGLGLYDLCRHYIEGEMQYGEITNLSYNGRNVVIEGKLTKEVDVNDIAITAVVTEDGIHPIAQEGKMEEGYTHDHVARKFLTSAFGDKLKVNDDLTFNLALEVGDLPSDTKIENTDVVVFASKKITEDTMKLYGNRKVLFSKSIRYDKDASIDLVEESRPEIELHNGHLVVRGSQVKSVSIYDMQGRMINSQNEIALAEGFYLVKIRTNTGVFTKKILIK